MAKKTDITNADVKNTEPAKSKNIRTEAKKSAPEKKETVFITVVQVGDKEFDITGIAEKALKAYKSVHKRKIFTDFVVYVKPEESAAYYTVNGEGSEEYKIEL